MRTMKPGNFRELGVNREADGVNFALEVWEDEPVSLLLYKKGGSGVSEEIFFPKEKIIGDVCAIKVQGLKTKDYEYNFRIGNKVIQDPYARILCKKGGFGERTDNEDGHQIRCGFMDEKYNWEGDKAPGIAYADAVMYNLHIRGFTKQSYSKVRHKGTFLGLQEKADYLQDLGINQVKLMPVYEFDELLPYYPNMHINYIDKKEAKKERINYWGYVEGFYFAPKRSYAATKDPVREFQNMVKTLHARNIEVILEFYFPPHVNPGLIRDCLIWWKIHYHIDGFHLMANHEICNMIARDPLFTETKLLSIYFPTEEIYFRNRVPKKINLAECNERFMIPARKLLKSDEDQLSEFVHHIRRNPVNHAVINYITNHDGFTLMDLVSYDEKHNEENEEWNQDGTNSNYSWNCGVEGATGRKKILELRRRQMRNAMLMLLLSQGTPMLLAGDEIGNSQGGNNNPYCLDNEISWVDWRAARRNENFTKFIKDAIAFRRRHRILHMPKELRVMDTLSCGYPDVSYHGNRAWYAAFEHTDRQIGVMYCGKYAGEDNFIYVAYNLHWTVNEFALPHLPEGMEWFLAADTEEGFYEEGLEPELTGQKMLEVLARTITVLIGRK